MYKILSLLWLLLPIATFILPVKIGQSRDKIFYILLAVVFYPGMMVAMVQLKDNLMLTNSHVPSVTHIFMRVI